MNVQTQQLVAVRGTVVNMAPAPGPQRSGKILLADKTVLSAFEDNLALVRIGGEYEFGVKVTFKDGGKQYFDVKKVSPLDPIKPNPNFVGRDEIEAQRRLTASAQPPQRSQVPQDAPINGNGFHPPGPAKRSPAPLDAAFPVEWQRSTHPRDSRRMFVCAMMTAEIAAGRVLADEEAYAERVAMWSRIHTRAVDIE
jgi:hypothetical protein